MIFLLSLSLEDVARFARSSNNRSRPCVPYGIAHSPSLPSGFWTLLTTYNPSWTVMHLITWFLSAPQRSAGLRNRKSASSSSSRSRDETSSVCHAAVKRTQFTVTADTVRGRRHESADLTNHGLFFVSCNLIRSETANGSDSYSEERLSILSYFIVRWSVTNR